MYAVKQIDKKRIYRLRPESSSRAHLLQSMKDEIDIMRTLQHKYIIDMYSTGSTL